MPWWIIWKPMAYKVAKEPNSQNFKILSLNISNDVLLHKLFYKVGEIIEPML